MADSTKQNFKSTYDSFDKFCQKKYNQTAEEKILEIPQDEDSEYDILQAWVNWLGKNNIIPSTVHTKFSALRRYFHYRGIKIYKEDIKVEITLPKIPKEEKHPLELSEIQKILREANFKKRALYLTLISSGMRVGEAVQLKKKHFNTSERQFMIKIPANSTKTKAGRTVFISKEASDAVRPLLKRIEDNDMVFAKNEKPHYAVCAEGMMFRKILRNTGLMESYDSSRTNKITIHSFRSYFFTKATRKHGDNYAHKMTGHGGYLMQYDRMTEGEKRAMYLELEPDLIIDSSQRQNARITELEKNQKRIDKLEDALNTLMFIANGKEWGNSDKDIDRLWEQFNPKFHEILVEAKKSGSKNL